jgi:hypothetical protein
MGSMRTLSLAWVVGLAVACSQEPSRPSSATTLPFGASPAAPVPSAKVAAVVLGEPVSAAVVALSDIARDPRAFAGRSLATSGTVTAVCQNMGCWMEIRDEAGNAHVRMHGHSFFIPKTASGRHARLQATVVPTEDAKECDESPSAAPAKGLARVELDATGVELD